MLSNMKRISAFLLALVMVFSLLPAGAAQAAGAEAPKELGQAAYAEVDLIFDQIDEAEAGPDKKDTTQAQKTKEAMAIVQASDSYVEGSLVQNGNSFTWWTDDGVRCVYSPRMRDIESKRTPETSCDEIVNEPVAVKGGSPTGNQVYLIGPYYGSDDTFTDQYKNQAKKVAAAIGDTDGYTLYSGTAATVDKVAEAVSNGAVVFFDSHGTTDYENPNDEYDFITGATSSYLCLTSTTGLTSSDYADGALYYSDGICINGATIANHMTKQSPAGLLWMAICLGMGTDTMCEPLREMGVEVVYGYSQSVTFEGDYRFSATFWEEFLGGATVAEAIATMKSKWGNWDWSTQIANDYGSYDGYSSISSARADYCAFPVVVSDEDTFPGQRTGGSNYGADSLQTVKSTYVLSSCEHTWVAATCSAPKTCSLCGATEGKALAHTDANTDEICDVCGLDISVAPNTYIKVTETPDDWEGKYLLVYETAGLAFNGALTTLESVSNTISVTIEDGVIILDEADADSYFTIAASGSSYTVQSASGYYIGNTSGSNKLQSSTSPTYTNTLSMDSDGSVLIKATDNSVLRFNKTDGQMRFRYYKSASYSSQEPIHLYKLAEGGTSSGGNTGGGETSCNHSYTSSVTTPPTCTAAGVTTYTCSACGDSYTESIAALGHTWTAATCTKPKTCSVCGATSGSTIAHADSNGDNACDTCGTSMGTTEPPVVTGGNTYVKVTTAPSDWSGQYLIVYENGALAFDGSRTTLDAVKNTVSVTITDGTIVMEDAVYFTIAASGSSYTIQSASGYYIGNTANSNKLLSSTSTAYTNTLSMESDGSVLIKASGGSFLRFNMASDQMRFRYYKSSSYSSQQPIALYKLVEETTHEHSYTSSVTTAPTCTAAGVTTYTCTGCGDSYTEAIAALGHTLGDEITENPFAADCINGGYYEIAVYCEVCDAELSRTEYTTPALGHTEAAAVTENIVDATCVAAGSYDSVVYCSVCNAEMSRETIATEATGEHTYVDGTCSVCGDKEVTGPATDDALVFFGTPGLSFQDYIGLQIMLKNSVAKDYDSFYVEITQVDFEGNATTIQTNGTPYTASYTFFEQQILSWSMTEQVTMTLYGVKGDVTYKGQSFTTSVEALALDKIPSYVSTGDMARAKALVDMLNFGSAVQTSYNHNTTDLPNADLGELAQYGTTGDPAFNATNDITGTNTIKVYSNNISMQSKVEFQFMAKTTALEGMTVVAKMGDTDIAVEYQPYSSYTIIRVPCGAAHMRDTFTIYITDANGALKTCTYNVTVEAYAAQQLSGEKAPAMKALLTYGDAVAAIG